LCPAQLPGAPEPLVTPDLIGINSNVLLFPTISQDTVRAGPLQCRERLGGLLKYYECEAA
jgi:hypothetical protein